MFYVAGPWWNREFVDVFISPLTLDPHGKHAQMVVQERSFATEAANTATTMRMRREKSHAEKRMQLKLLKELPEEHRLVPIGETFQWRDRRWNLEGETKTKEGKQNLPPPVMLQKLTVKCNQERKMIKQAQILSHILNQLL
eukprot:GHVT01022461.1.p3 GENE.GHVT01022461.1~~GHVT01022461.1.p3  ORF type:complete len:141 (+),score=24.27 GHVT01022461.1:402-824(+)